MQEDSQKSKEGEQIISVEEVHGLWGEGFGEDKVKLFLESMCNIALLIFLLSIKKN